MVTEREIIPPNCRAFQRPRSPIFDPVAPARTYGSF